jgi:galactokinase
MQYSVIRNKFLEIFSKDPLLISAPGRINLIGEHTDYNEGFVLPAAIDKTAVFAVASNNIRKYRFYAFDLKLFFETETIEPVSDEYHWANYLLGILDQFNEEGVTLKGVDCVFGSDIPLGAGLSSSAAIECGFAFGLNQLFDAGFNKFQLVKMSQKAEHKYAGVMCGIMDQYASIFGKKDHVLKLDCRSNQHKYVPFKMKNDVIALVDTKVKHELASSAYNERRAQCNEGVAILQQFNPAIESLRDVSESFLKTHKSSLDPVIHKRCQYVIQENSRVGQACYALEKNDLHELGELMYRSHDGLQYNYEVSCKELDFLVQLTRDLSFVYGSRMMGGGFGGCTINLIEKGNEQEFQTVISEKYKLKTDITPDIYFVEISEGVSIVT